MFLGTFPASCAFCFSPSFPHQNQAAEILTRSVKIGEILRDMLKLQARYLPFNRQNHLRPSGQLITSTRVQAFSSANLLGSIIEWDIVEYSNPTQSPNCNSLGKVIKVGWTPSHLFPAGQFK